MAVSVTVTEAMAVTLFASEFLPDAGTRIPDAGLRALDGAAWRPRGRRKLEFAVPGALRSRLLDGTRCAPCRFS